LRPSGLYHFDGPIELSNWGQAMTEWLLSTLRQYPELAIFLALAVGFWIGPKKFRGFNLAM
jgi:hypothetical protein